MFLVFFFISIGLYLIHCWFFYNSYTKKKYELDHIHSRYWEDYYEHEYLDIKNDKFLIIISNTVETPKMINAEFLYPIITLDFNGKDILDKISPYNHNLHTTEIVVKWMLKDFPEIEDNLTIVTNKGVFICNDTFYSRLKLN